jgi:uracil-DNA glycosylase
MEHTKGMDDLRVGRGDPWDHDPGPPRNRSWARLFAETPNYRALGLAAAGEERFRWQFGPVFYRGRLGDHQARVLVVGQDAGSDEALAHRSFVGESGTRVQHLLAHVGITRSYLCLNTFVYSILGQYDATMARLAQDPDSPLVRHRNRLFDYAAARNDLRLVVAVGRAARESVLTWIRHRGGTAAGGGHLHGADASALGPALRMVDVTHPGAAASGGLADVQASFSAAADRILGWAAKWPDWLPADPDGARASVGTFAFGAAPVPLRDLPFGTPWRVGAGGTASARGDGGRSLELRATVEEPGAHGGNGHGGHDAEASFPAEPTSSAGRDGFAEDEGDLAWEPPRSVLEFDRGPTPSLARLLVSGAPDFAALGVPGAGGFGGGAVYRGRFAGVRMLVLADQQGHDDLLLGRAFCGEAGQRFQGLLAALGVTRSYLVLRTLPVDTEAESLGKQWALADRPDVVAAHRAVCGRVLDDNPVVVVVTVGPHAERIAGRLDLDGQPVVSLPAWGAPGASEAWTAAHARLRSLGIPIDQPPTTTTWRGERAQIPRADLPFGAPRWQGTSGDRVVRSTAAPPVAPHYKAYMPGWVLDEEIPPLG